MSPYSLSILGLNGISLLFLGLVVHILPTGFSWFFLSPASNLVQISVLNMLVLPVTNNIKSFIKCRNREQILSEGSMGRHILVSLKQDSERPLTGNGVNAEHPPTHTFL